MPMPHRTQMQLIKRRLVGKEGVERIRELRAILEDLPDYRNGPYADIRKWVNAQLVETRKRGRVVARDSIAVRRQGAAQIALVGPPNVGKSTLLQALSDIQIRTGDFAFTTTRPVAAVTRIQGVEIQLVEIPGLIEGAAQGRGGGRALLGVLRHADGMVFCHDSRQPPESLLEIRGELIEAGIALPALVAATRRDEAITADLAGLRRAAAGLEVIPVSVLDEDSLSALRAGIWLLSGLIRIHLRDEAGGTGRGILSFRPPVSVVDVANAIHHDLARRCTGARLWGPSARFPGQRVGRDHPLVDGDQVAIVG
jgi:small GTP-binding protein